MGVIGIPRWLWGSGGPGGWQREYIEWLARYHRTGVAEEAPSWAVWLEEWGAWSQAERITYVRRSIMSLTTRGALEHDALRTHELRVGQGTREEVRYWSRLALTVRLKTELTLAEVVKGGQDGRSI